eukprot:sb/3475070/
MYVFYEIVRQIRICGRRRLDGVATPSRRRPDGIRLDGDVPIDCVFAAYSLWNHSAFTVYYLRIRSAFTAYSLCIHSAFTAYSLWPPLIPSPIHLKLTTPSGRRTLVLTDSLSKFKAHSIYLKDFLDIDSS